MKSVCSVYLCIPCQLQQISKLALTNLNYLVSRLVNIGVPSTITKGHFDEGVSNFLRERELLVVAGT